MHRTYSLSAYNRRKHGGRVQKIPLDAGFSCPNRDGSISRSGCVFCNEKGSGSGMGERGLSIAEQWTFWRDHHRERNKLSLFAAYFQSYSNTHGPIEGLAAALEELRGLPDLVGLSVGTRPDCLDEAKLDLLALQRERLGIDEVSLELGLQSACDETLVHINRGHDVRAFAEATRAAHGRGLSVVAHLIAGLPTPYGREGRAELLASVDLVNRLPVSGVKFHNLYVCRGAALERDHADGAYAPMTQDEYLDWLGEALMRLRPDMVVHRLNGNPSKGELIAPKWAGNMRGLHNAVRNRLESGDVWQGKRNGAEDGPSPWFSPDFRGDVP